MIEMIRDRVAVLLVEEAPASAVLLPEVTKGKALVRGEVISTGPQVLDIAEGDTVLFPKLACEVLPPEDVGDLPLAILCAGDVAAVAT